MAFGGSAQPKTRALRSIQVEQERYLAPELVREGRNTHTNKIDVWAMGCILYELAFGRKAFSNDTDVLSYLQSEERPEIPFDLSSATPILPIDSPFRGVLANIIETMLEIEPSHRPPARSLTETFTALYRYMQDKDRDPSAVQLRAVLADSALPLLINISQFDNASPVPMLQFNRTPLPFSIDSLIFMYRAVYKGYQQVRYTMQ